MKQIYINSLPAVENIEEIASQLNVCCTQSGDEIYIEVPELWGSGTFSAVQFIGGLSLVEYQGTFHEDVEIHFIDDNIHPLKLLYCLQGLFHVKFENEEEFRKMEKYHSAILASEGWNGHIFRFPGGVTIDIKSVNIDRAVFRKRYNNVDGNCHYKLQDIFSDHEAKYPFYHNGMYSVSLSDLFMEMDEHDQSGIIRAVYQEGKTLEVLSHQLILYDDDLKGKNDQKVLRQYEMDLIHEVTNIIKDELEDICTIPELARRIGLNVNKIQEGFKAVYKMTVNQYIHQVRMEHATHLLKYSDLNVSEIVNKVGLNSKSYFSKIFKEAYQLTPTQYRKQKRKKAG